MARIIRTKMVRNTVNETGMIHNTDDLRIKEIKELLPPGHVIREFPATENAATTVFRARESIHRILHGADDRVLVVIGPCSIHDPNAALEYAKRLAEQRARLERDLIILLRVYFEKLRTTVGWKGLINDPRLDGSFRINEGLRTARSLFLDIADLGLLVGCEFLDPISPQHTSDTVSWGAIGAAPTGGHANPPPASGKRR